MWQFRGVQPKIVIVLVLGTFGDFESSAKERANIGSWHTRDNMDRICIQMYTPRFACCASHDLCVHISSLSTWGIWGEGIRQLTLSRPHVASPVRWKHWRHGGNAARKVIVKWGKLSNMFPSSFLLITFLTFPQKVLLSFVPQFFSL